MQDIIEYTKLIVFLPLVAALITGLLSHHISRSLAHSIAIAGVGISCILSGYVFYQSYIHTDLDINFTVYEWLSIGKFNCQIGFMVDRLSATMMLVVTSVSFAVHVYTIGYMEEDAGYHRFFSYISLFTFAMLMLVISNNFVQLFFGWEAVGLVSYLLIGFWFKKSTAIAANMKAFLVNRVGDFGFILAIGAIALHCDNLDYVTVFQQLPRNIVLAYGAGDVSLITFVCAGLFIGAMGKSAQIPLHVWLPDSMEGPTPISALIHAATMVTAGVFMLARMSHLFEYAPAVLNTVLIIGSLTCFMMGVLALFQYDIKRIIAYSTLSQLGYMIVAAGASAYSASIFHLATHAFFKAGLFLAAGAIIIVLHHEQDIRKMGGLYKYMPITYITTVIASLSLAGFPGLSGFYSKDLIIEAVALSKLPAASISLKLLLTTVFLTSLYSFRMLFIVFHGKENVEVNKSHLHEPHWVVWLPLVALAIPAIGLGLLGIDPILNGFYNKEILVMPLNNVLSEFAQHYHGAFYMFTHGFTGAPFKLVMAGLLTAWLMYICFPSYTQSLGQHIKPFRTIFDNAYGFDSFNKNVIASGTRLMGRLFWKVGDVFVIDGMMVNGGAKVFGAIGRVVRRIQTGYLYHYVFIMFCGLFILMLWSTYNQARMGV